MESRSKHGFLVQFEYADRRGRMTRGGREGGRRGDGGRGMES